jgi:hypothetical protein
VQNENQKWEEAVRMGMTSTEHDGRTMLWHGRIREDESITTLCIATRTLCLLALYSYRIENRSSSGTMR